MEKNRPKKDIIMETMMKETSIELENNILSYWMQNMCDEKNGGFFGRITGEDINIPQAPKGAILNMRILWTFSAAYRILKKEEYLYMATRAKTYIENHFFDKMNGGVYWMLDYKGNPIDKKKQIYAQGFAIYGLSEYHRATGDPTALHSAISIFSAVEHYSHDNIQGGYIEALDQYWLPLEDMRLSEKDENEKKTMNTHLHLLEPYTNLYKVWKNDTLKKRLEQLIGLFLDRILDPETHHLQLFFDNEWQNKKECISYGHDIEAAWLLHEAAMVLADDNLIARVNKVAPLIVAAVAEGIAPDGSLIYECEVEKKDYERHWWVQAEGVVGFLNDYQYFGNEKSLETARILWNYIKSHLIDNKHGEWYWSIKEDGSVNKTDDKAGFWKCPYHNARMCLEIVERFGSNKTSD